MRTLPPTDSHSPSDSPARPATLADAALSVTAAIPADAKNSKHGEQAARQGCPDPDQASGDNVTSFPGQHSTAPLGGRLAPALALRLDAAAPLPNALPRPAAFAACSI